MRVFAFLLLLWCTVLSAVPCCAFDGCADEECKTEQSAPVHEDKHDDCGGCSPFFACAGCSGFVVEEGFCVKPIATAMEFAQPQAIVCEGSVQDYSPSFWQPPRL